MKREKNVGCEYASLARVDLSLRKLSWRNIEKPGIVVSTLLNLSFRN